MTYNCEAGKTVTCLVGGSVTFESRYQSSGDWAFVGSGVESCQPVSCDTSSPSDTPHATVPTSSFVYLVTCGANYSTDMRKWQANSYSVTCDEAFTLTGLGGEVTMMTFIALWDKMQVREPPQLHHCCLRNAKVAPEECGFVE